MRIFFEMEIIVGLIGASSEIVIGWKPEAIMRKKLRKTRVYRRKEKGRDTSL